VTHDRTVALHNLALLASLPPKRPFNMFALILLSQVYAYVSILFLHMLAIFQKGFGVRMKHRLHLLVRAFWTSCSSGYKGICALVGLGWLVGGIKKKGRKRQMIYNTTRTQNLNKPLYGGRSSLMRLARTYGAQLHKQGAKTILMCTGTTNQTFLTWCIAME
jgi:hypothetical protein